MNNNINISIHKNSFFPKTNAIPHRRIHNKTFSTLAINETCVYTYISSDYSQLENTDTYNVRFTMQLRLKTNFKQP